MPAAPALCKHKPSGDSIAPGDCEHWIDTHTTLSDLGNIGELIGAIAVLITLIYLAIQVRNSTNSNRAATLDAILSDWRTSQRETFVLNPANVELWRKGLSNFDSLNANDKTILNFILGDNSINVRKLPNHILRINT